MFKKINILPIIKGHFRTLRNDATNKLSKGDIFLHFAVPAVAVGYCFWRVDLNLTESYPNIIAALAIIFGFAFAAVVFIFQLRMQMAEMQIVSRSSTVAEIAPQIDTSAPILVNEMFSNCLYAVVVSGASVLCTSLVDGFGYSWFGDYLIVALVSHLVIVLLMCFKRINAAFGRIANIDR